MLPNGIPFHPAGGHAPFQSAGEEPVLYVPLRILQIQRFSAFGNAKGIPRTKGKHIIGPRFQYHIGKGIFILLQGIRQHPACQGYAFPAAVMQLHPVVSVLLGGADLADINALRVIGPQIGDILYPGTVFTTGRRVAEVVPLSVKGDIRPDYGRHQQLGILQRTFVIEKDPLLLCTYRKIGMEIRAGLVFSIQKHDQIFSLTDVPLRECPLGQCIPVIG